MISDDDVFPDEDWPDGAPPQPPPVAVPHPGGQTTVSTAGAGPASASQPYNRGSATDIQGTPGRGPLVECAFRLLSLAPLLRAPSSPVPPEQLRDQFERELKAFKERAREKGLDPQHITNGHYALCALLDDIILNTPWGAHGVWAKNTLTGALHFDAAAGVHFFDRLKEETKQPERNRPILELMAACLALGFEGRYRKSPQEQAALRQIRADLYATLQRLDGKYDEDISDTRHNVPAPHVPIERRIPLWVIASGVLGILMVVYAVLTVQLSIASERLDTVLAGLPPAGPVTITRPIEPEPPPPKRITTEPTQPPVVVKIRNCLPEELTRNQPEAVTDNPERLRIRLPSSGLFASGSAELQPAVEPLIICVAEALKDTQGQIAIVGHSDNVPIHTLRFPSNWVLSEARAEAVAAIARPVLGTRPIQVKGSADSVPVAPNNTDDGRSQNRRVEILLFK